jgi:hypothetical protein
LLFISLGRYLRAPGVISEISALAELVVTAAAAVALEVAQKYQYQWMPMN